jgi:hypothetical protein
MVQMAREDLSRRTSIPTSDMVVASAASETWRDASLGCPQPGKAYAQVLTPGYLIVLEARGQRYEYHASTTRVVLCQTP